MANQPAQRKEPIVKILITQFSESDRCQWCSRTTEGVTAHFEAGFLARGHLCWKCLQRATRVHATQKTESPAENVRTKEAASK